MEREERHRVALGGHRPVPYDRWDLPLSSISLAHMSCVSVVLLDACHVGSVVMSPCDVDDELT